MNDVSDADGHVRVELGLYVLGALNDEETAVVDAHLAWCDACWNDYDYISSVPAMLATLTDADVSSLLEAEPAPPAAAVRVGPAHVRSRSRSGSARPARSSIGRPWSPPGHARTPAQVAARRASGQQKERDTRPAAGRRASRGKVLILAAVVMLAAGAGASMLLRNPRAVDQTPARFAASASDTSRGVSGSVAVTAQGDDSNVVLTVRGLAPGARYYLSVVTRGGRTVPVGEWRAEGSDQTVAGRVAITATELSFFAVTGEDRSVILSIPLSQPSSAPA